MNFGGQIPWNVTPICEASQIYFLMGRRPMKDVLGNHWKDWLFHLVHWVSISLLLRRTSQESINLERKSFLDCSSETHCTRGEFGRVTYWSQTLRSWRRWTHRKSTQEDSMRMRWYFPKTRENLFFQSQMDESKPLEEIKTWEHPPWYGSNQFEEKVTLIFLENQKGLFRHLTTRFRMPVKQLMTSGPCQETSYTAITSNPESSFTRREKNHSLFHVSTLTYPELLIRIWVSSKRNASMIIGISMGQETCQILGQVSHNILYWKKNLLMDCCGPGGDWQENSLHPGQIICGQSSGKMGKHAKLKEKQNWSEERIHLENDGKLWWIYFIDPEDTEFKETIKNARKNLETLIAHAMPCKITKKNCGSGASNKIKTRLSCILEASESTRLRMGESLPNHHEDHIAGKGENSLQHYNLVHKFIPMPQAMKIPAAKGAVDKECEQLVKISAWNLTKVRSKKVVIDEARTNGAQVHFASLMDICHLKNAELETKHQKYKGRVVLRGDILKDDSWSYAEQGSSASQMTAAKIMDIISRLLGCDGQAADAISAYTQVKMEDAPKLFLLIPKSECPDIWIRLPRHKWPKSWSSMEDPVVPLDRNLYGHPLAELLWERQVEKILLKYGWEKVSKLGMLVRTPSIRVILICVCGCHKIGWQETKHWSNVQITQQKSRFGRTNIFPGSCILGMHSTTMPKKQRYCGQLQNHVRIANFSGRSRKASILWEFSYFFMVLWYGRSCKEMCGAILWVIKQDDSTTLQSIYSLHRWPSL